MDSNHYILNGKDIVPCDLMTWARWLEGTESRRVAFDKVGTEAEVSTVFLGLNDNFGDGPPILFETLVFGGAHAGEGDRYSTWAEAEAGHKEILARVQASVGRV